MSTPVLFRTLEVLTVAVVVVFLIVTAYAFASARNTFGAVGAKTATAARSAFEVQTALAEMDTSVAEAMLVNGDRGRQPQRDQALASYQRSAARASDSAVSAAEALDGGDARPVRDVLNGVSEYQRRVERALLLQQRGDDAGALAEYRQATDQMQGSLLPRARELTDANVAQLDAKYSEQNDQIQMVSSTVSGVIVACFFILAVSQVFLFRRTRRVLNGGLLAASLLLVGGTTMAGAGLSNASTNLRAAKVDAFDSIVTLSRARATLYGMRGSQSAYLLEPDGDRRKAAEQRYLREAQALLSTPTGSATIASYSSLATAFSNEESPATFSNGYRGLFVDAFTSTSFQTERDNLKKMVASYARFQAGDLAIRNPNAPQPDVLVAYFQLSLPTIDDPIAASIDVNTEAFDAAIDRGNRVATFWQIVLPLVALASIALVVLGFRPRIAEYQRS